MGTAGSGGTTARAILLVCLAGLLFVTMNSLVKALSTRFDPVMLIWARYFFHVVLIVVLYPRALPAAAAHGPAGRPARPVAA